jgi:hypothetical protein
MWQPIETAPIDTRVLLWCADLTFDNGVKEKRPVGAVFGVVRPYPGLENKAYATGFSGDWEFTHWHPLPDPPDPTPA